MIDLEIPKKFVPLVKQARSVAEEVMWPIARKYDLAEHEYPAELDLLSGVIDGLDDSGTGTGAGAKGASQVSEDTTGHVGDGKKAPEGSSGVRNGTNMSSALSIMETCRGDVGLTLSLPRQGLGNAAIAAVATEEQKKRYGTKWASMAITEPEAGSDAAAIRTTARKEGDEYVLNGEKIYVTAGERSDLVVVWASLDLSLGRAAIKSFVVYRTNPGLTLERLEHKLGIRASDTAAFRLNECRVPATDLLGDPEIRTETGFGGAMQTFDNTRPLVAAMAIGVARACLDLTTKLLKAEGVVADPDRPAVVQSAAAARLLQMEADYESAYLLTLRAAWMADNAQPNSVQASMAKAKAGRTCVSIAMSCIELAGATGYAERDLLEKWARDGKILDIFEGTQQIQLLVIARRLLELSSSQLK
jgi:acyl-CoA dehydrogenase